MNCAMVLNPTETGLAKRFCQLLLAGLLGVAGSLALAKESPANAASHGAKVIALTELPAEGRATYALILQGGPFPFQKDGTVFGNRERLLAPQKRGYYLEYTVKTPGAQNRGAKRIVCGGPARNPDACFYTKDHYASFRRIVN